MLGHLGELAFANGNPEQALRLTNESLKLYLTGKNAAHIAMFFSNSAAYRIALGDLTGARESAHESLRFARQVQNELTTLIALQHTALLAVLGGDAGRAAKLWGYVNGRYRQLGYQREGTEQWSCDALTAALHEAFDPDARADLEAEGAHWSENEAVEEALKFDNDTGSAASSRRIPQHQ